jgi:hypothetical protein
MFWGFYFGVIGAYCRIMNMPPLSSSSPFLLSGRIEEDINQTLHGTMSFMGCRYESNERGRLFTSQ